MSLEPQVGLPELLTGFRQEFAEAVAVSSQRFRQDLQSLQNTLEKQLDQRLSTVEKALSGPLSHSLPWDWVPDSSEYPDIDSFLDNRRLRYRGDPCYIVSAREYYGKYCAAQVDVLKELQIQGHFYTPPPSRLFLKFGREVADGKKRIFHDSEIRKSGVPQDQIDLAWTAEGPSIVQEMQAYLPLGTPITRAEKEYYLDVIHTVRGVKYQPVLPITDIEMREMDGFREEMKGCFDAIIDVETYSEALNSATQDLKELSQLSQQDWAGNYEEMARRQEEARRTMKGIEAEVKALQGEVEEKRRIEENMRKQESENSKELTKMMETDYNESVFEDIAADRNE